MAQRPLSPHLQIYRPMLSMMMSILHRLTGLGLVAGVIGFVVWLCFAAVCPTWFEYLQSFFGHWLGKIILIGMTWALLHHMLGGFRHFIWDTGQGFGLRQVEALVRANLIGSILLTAALWILYGVFA